MILRPALCAACAILLASLGCARETPPRPDPAPSPTATTATASGSYRLSLIPQEDTTFSGRHHELRFRVVDQGDRSFTALRVVDGAAMRLRVVRGDLGTTRTYVPRFEESTEKWIVPIDFEADGPHELIAEFVPDVAGAGPTTVRRSVVVRNP